MQKATNKQRTALASTCITLYGLHEALSDREVEAKEICTIRRSGAASAVVDVYVLEQYTI